MRFKFSKKLRLLNSSDFAYVFQQPKRIVISQFIILGRPNMLGYPRMGISISKKNIKYANERNRIKRIIRESFRLNQHKIPTIDFIIIVGKELTKLDNNSILVLLDKLWYFHYHSWFQKY